METWGRMECFQALSPSYFSFDWGAWSLMSQLSCDGARFPGTVWPPDSARPALAASKCYRVQVLDPMLCSSYPRDN